MSPKDPRRPPWKTPKPYFRHDAQNFKDANRPHWTLVQLSDTIETIWHGDEVIRDYYAARTNRKALPGLPPGRDVIPPHPYNQQDVARAKAHRVLPPRRDATGNPIPLMPAAPPLPAPRPRNHYPYDFWPRGPWHPDPNNGTQAMALDVIENKPKVWLRTAPHQWPLRDERNMRGSKWLGKGAYGCAGLWCQVSATNTIERKFVIKEAKPTRDQWRDPLLWRDQVPQEIRIHQVVDENRDNTTSRHKNVTEHHGYRLMMRQRRYRIYLNYYEGGDLSAALGQFPSAELRDRYRPAHRWRDHAPRDWNWDSTFLCYRKNGNLPQVLSERLICEIIDSLAAACQILHFGQVDSEAAPEGTHRVTHCDIKPDNIFVQTSEKDEDFPAFVLADYGMAFFSHGRQDTDGVPPGLLAPPENPDEHTFTGFNFDNIYAPESYDENQKLNPRPLGEKTDVWQIGAIFFWLLTNGFRHSRAGPTCFHRGALVNVSSPYIVDMTGREDGTDSFCSNTYPTLLRYSPALRNLCARCVNWNPDDRPSLSKIREEIRLHLAAHPWIRDDRNMDFVNVGRDSIYKTGEKFPANVAHHTLVIPRGMWN